MEKSLAAMHQARLRHSVTLIYGSTDEQVGLFVRCHAADPNTIGCVLFFPPIYDSAIRAGCVKQSATHREFCILKNWLAVPIWLG
jgi:hypothetical protein